MNYRITINVKNVAEADATDLAQRIWDAHAHDLDAALGDFTLGITVHDGGRTFSFDWEPDEA